MMGILYRLLKVVTSMIIFCLEVYVIVSISNNYGWFEDDFVSYGVLLSIVAILNILIPLLKKKKGRSYFKGIIFNTIMTFIVVFVFMEVSSLVNSVTPDVKAELSDWYYFGPGLVWAILFQIAIAIPELYLYLNKPTK